jgi:hypothetical protein
VLWNHRRQASSTKGATQEVVAGSHSCASDEPTGTARLLDYLLRGESLVAQLDSGFTQQLENAALGRTVGLYELRVRAPAS